MFDALNRVTLKVVPDACVSGFACTTPPANAVRDVYYGYDLVGLQLYARFDSASGSDGVVASYDGFGREASETVTMGAASRTVGYQYDADGNRTRITWPDAAYVTYSYDGLDRMTAAQLGGGATLATMSYDAGGQQAGETRGAVTTTFGYDAIGRLSSLADDLAGASADLTSTYAYSPASQLVSRTRSNTGYAWTGYVNVSRAYAVNGLNQYTSAGSATFGYDANGNLASDGTASYTFDAENRLVADAATTLDYDPMGRLAKVANAATTETYLYAGDQRIAEYDASGSMTARYVPGAGGDNPLIQYAGSATTAPQALQGDERGSIVSVADASGALVAINSYDEYGIPAAGNVGRYGYTGQMWVPQLGLWYYKARFYSPTLARFLQTDPIGYKDQANLYAYVGNDPMNRLDPTGQRETCANGMCVMTADSFSEKRSNGQTTVASNDTKQLVEANKNITGPKGDHEAAATVERSQRLGGPDKVKVQTGGKFGVDNNGNTGTVHVGPFTRAGIHWHTNTVDGKASGFVDSVAFGRTGDASSLLGSNPVPMATIANGYVGWHEIVNGQLQFSYPAGSMTNDQKFQMQGNLDIQQRFFQK